MQQVDMDELKTYNPKLHDKLIENPRLILDLKENILQNLQSGEAAADVEAVAAAADALQHKPSKNYSLPFIWAWFAPVFSVTSVALIKL
jgi:hypothetical protein